MADEADIGNDYMEKWLSHQIAEHQHQLGKTAIAYEQGRCRNCNERIDDGRAFCDTDCRTDFDARQRAEKRRGRA